MQVYLLGREKKTQTPKHIVKQQMMAAGQK